MADQTGMSPESIAGAVSQPLDQMSPEILGQMMQTQNAAPLPPLA